MKRSFFMFLILAGSSLALAQTPQAPPPQACCGAMEKQSDSGIPYASGGVGEDERQALTAMASKYSLKLVFAGKGSGEFLSNVKVAVKDRKGGTVLDAVADGPWLFAKLPPGSYQVTASVGEQHQTRPVSVHKGKLATLAFYF